MPYLARLGVGDLLHVAVLHRGAGQHARLRRLQPQRDQPGARRRRGAPRSSSRRCRRHGLGHIVDFVPNHMGIGTGGNAWWTTCSRTARARRRRSSSTSTGRRSRPSCTRSCCCRSSATSTGTCSNAASCSSSSATARWCCSYFEHELPVNPRQAPRVYRLAVEPLTAELGADNPHLHEFLSILASLENLPPYTEQDPERIAERQREKEVAQSRLARLVAGVAGRRPAHRRRRPASSTARPGTPDIFDALHALLEAQAYRLAYWRTASHEINYRRFFDVNTLAGLRVEEPEVFDATHALLGRCLATAASGRSHRSSRRPVRSAALLRDAAGARAPRAHRSPPGSSRCTSSPRRSCRARDGCRRHWAVHGTTGYNFLNDLNGIFVDAAQARRAAARLRQAHRAAASRSTTCSTTASG